MSLTKSNYIAYKQCPKSLWLKKNSGNNPTTSNAKYEQGHLITEAAWNLFPDGKLVPFDSENAMFIHTKRLIAEKNEVIFEGTFKFDDILVRCDILAHHNGGWNLYEVKSATSMQERYIDDLAIQMYVLKNSNLKIKSTNIIYINNTYTRGSQIDYSELFMIENVTNQVEKLLSTVVNDINQMKKIPSLPSFNQEIGRHCNKYGKDKFECEFKDGCWSHLPENSIFDITRIGDKAFQLYERGIYSIKDIPENYSLSESQKLQVNALKDNREILEKATIADFLSNFSYPLYFLDFETFQQPIPMYEGLKPYQQIPFQYSLHIVKDEQAPLQHKEFLAIEGLDPRREIAESLVRAIPIDVCSVAYNMSFEKRVLRELAELFPDLAEHLMNIHDNMVDLMVPFQKKWWYKNEMKGSYSIKYVLPALFPHSDELNYKNLDIQNGSMAMDIYQTLHLRSKEERAVIRKQLLAYCRLDTLAMVRIWEELTRVVTKKSAR